MPHETRVQSQVGHLFIIAGFKSANVPRIHLIKASPTTVVAASQCFTNGLAPEALRSSETTFYKTLVHAQVKNIRSIDTLIMTATTSQEIQDGPPRENKSTTSESGLEVVNIAGLAGSIASVNGSRTLRFPESANISGSSMMNSKLELSEISRL
jgi:hypothetical protein